ncbi:hypothetical protein HDU98_006343 [Podochytrium sp. JEL0797]|nr:hypothetical protein HDU98_006343 [Podochytrium sp. JEL0797]
MSTHHEPLSAAALDRLFNIAIMTHHTPSSPTPSHSSALSTPRLSQSHLATASSPTTLPLSPSLPPLAGLSPGDTALPLFDHHHHHLIDTIGKPNSIVWEDAVNMNHAVFSMEDLLSDSGNAWAMEMLAAGPEPDNFSLEDFLNSDPALPPPLSTLLYPASVDKGNGGGGGLKQGSGGSKSLSAVDDNGLFTFSLTEPVVFADQQDPTANPNLLDHFALHLMDQIFFNYSSESAPAPTNQNKTAHSPSTSDCTNALKSDHLLRMLDNPAITLHSILNDPSVVLVPEEDAAPSSAVTPFFSASRVDSCSTPLSATPTTAITSASTTPQDSSDPFAFLDEMMDTAAATMSTPDISTSPIIPVPLESLQTRQPTQTRPRSLRKRSLPVSRSPLETLATAAAGAKPVAAPRTIKRAKILPEFLAPVIAPATRTTRASASPAKKQRIPSAPATTAQVVNPNDILKLPKCEERDLFVCPHPGCDFGCARRYNLKIHFMTHIPIPHEFATEEETAAAAAVVVPPVDMYTCFVCGKCMRRRFDMQRHRAAVHGVGNEVGDDGEGWDEKKVLAGAGKGKKGKGVGA